MDTEKIEELIYELLKAIGEDPEREGLKETPARVARMYEEIFSGIGKDAKEVLGKKFTVENPGIVIEKDIVFHSMCEHHLLPFTGKAHIAYLPGKEVVGLSKLARTVEIYAKRPQLQERLCNQTAEALMEFAGVRGSLVIIEAEHMCMSMRGVKKPGTLTVTVSARGVFEEDLSLRKEVMDLMKMGNR